MHYKSVILNVFPALFLAAGVTSAMAAPPSRVLARVDDGRRVYLNGNLHVNARAEYDQGAVDPSLQLTHLTLNFKPSQAQQATLDQLLADQQNPASPNYHHWLTPEEFGARFGVSAADLAQATSWLQSHGFTITGTARARNFVTFDGPASSVQAAFRTQLHHYRVDGELHFANATEPSLPAALQPIVGSIQGLHDFRLKPHFKSRAYVPNNTTSSGNHQIAPDDLTTIYNIKPLHAAGIDGTGQKIAIVGQTNIRVSDLQQFRTLFNLPGQDPQLVLVANTRDPGINRNDLGEADLDIEWSSSIARNATIVYVYAPSVDQSWQYVVDQNLAPVMSSSYGSCEQSNGANAASSLRTLAQQANAQGITWFSASGDSGGADCAGGSSSNGVASVDLPASLPEVTGVGGTEFNEGAGSYWNSTNDANRASAFSYIPEMAWNDSAYDGSPSSSGGGASVYFGKPTWQTGAGVPSDSARDVPDVSLAASADHDGFIMYTSNSAQIVGGTSVSSPMFAGIAALLNQYLVQRGVMATPGLGNINPKLYSLAQTSPAAFHDILTGSNIVTAACPRRGCTTPPVPVGFNAAAGYDQATGLGSVDVYALATAWAGGNSRAIPNMSVSSSTINLGGADSATLTATVTSPDGNTPTGSVTFLLGSDSIGGATLTGANATATATLSVPASRLAAGANNITAQYNSDNSTFSNAAATVTLTVAPNAASLAITGIAEGASFGHRYAPGQILSIFGTGLATSADSASSVPLPTTLGGATVTIGGFSAPLLLASPSQLNVQIPYEVPLNSNAAIIVRTAGQVASYSFDVSATGPGIFTDSNGAPVPGASGKPGDTLTLFITGAGAVLPSIGTGKAPASGTATGSLPVPVNQPVTVTVGGLNAAIAFAGIPAGLVGVMQINYVLPATLPAGSQPVVVTVGTASSAEAHLTVTR